MSHCNSFVSQRKNNMEISCGGSIVRRQRGISGKGNEEISATMQPRQIKSGNKLYIKARKAPEFQFDRVGVMQRRFAFKLRLVIWIDSTERMQ